MRRIYTGLCPRRGCAGVAARQAKKKIARACSPIFLAQQLILASTKRIGSVHHILQILLLGKNEQSDTLPIGSTSHMWRYARWFLHGHSLRRNRSDKHHLPEHELRQVKRYYIMTEFLYRPAVCLSLQASIGHFNLVRLMRPGREEREQNRQTSQAGME